MPDYPIQLRVKAANKKKTDLSAKRQLAEGRDAARKIVCLAIMVLNEFQIQR